MKVTVKLYALLAKYLPRDAVDNQIQLDVSEGSTPNSVLKKINVPLKHCHLLLVNGVYVAPSARDTYTLKENDALAAWPPIAGG